MEKPVHDPAGDGDAQGEGSTSPWEWVAAGVGLLLVAGTLAFLIAHALQDTRTPPDPLASVVHVQPQDGRYLVRVRVFNRGALPAARLRLVATLREGQRTVEEVETEFEHVPAGSVREAGVFFVHDPAGLQLELSARSYEQP